MDLQTLLHSEEIAQIVRQYGITKLEKRQASYNLFTISSYNSYLENFHSDILASLLNPEGLHQQGYTFLHLFIAYLNRYYNTNISDADFKNSIVTREKGRLDIWIRDEASRQSIIIENKINNAVDMEEQIDRYFAYCEQSQGYTVKAIVYLSLDGTKHAPPTIENLKHLVNNIGAFTKSENDLVNGWLQPCLASANHMDSSSVIHQYIKLIKHLANNNMDTNTMESLYGFLSQHNGMDTVQTLVEMNGRMSSYRADRFAKEVTDYAPFGSKFRYKPNYWLFDYYTYQDCNLKLDIWFDASGNASLVFWNTKIEGSAGRKIVKEQLSAINMLHEFEDEVLYNDNGYPKYFVIGDQYTTMAEVDDAVVAFVKRFMAALRGEG